MTTIQDAEYDIASLREFAARIDRMRVAVADAVRFCEKGLTPGADEAVAELWPQPLPSGEDLLQDLISIVERCGDVADEWEVDL